MFWTVFFSMLIVAYLIGVLLVMGIIVARWHTIEEASREDYWYTAFACVLSWFTIGIFAVAAYEEAIEDPKTIKQLKNSKQ